MSNILLSICIPTYNRASTVYRNVKKHLEIIPENVEIVVSDNGSKDNTVELLKSIEDKRLKLYKNSTNKGYAYNYIKVLKVAKGDFALMMSDEDLICTDEFFKLLKNLEDEKIREEVALFVYDFNKDSRNSSKEDEILNLVYGRCAKMDGIIFNKLKMDSYCFEKIDNFYVHIFVGLKVSTKGKVLYINKELIDDSYEDSFQETVELDLLNLEQRFEQLKNDFYCTINLKNLDWGNKLLVLNKIYFIKLTYTTLTNDLLIRSNNLKNKFMLRKNDFSHCIEIFEKFLDEYSKYLNVDLKIIFKVEDLNKSIFKIYNIRKKYDILSNYLDFKVFLFISSSSFISIFKEFNFKVDYYYLSTKDVLFDKFDNKINLISFEELKKVNNLLLVINKDNKRVNDIIKLMDYFNIKNFQIIFIEDLNLIF